ncbi:hypothetical protein GGX14DRAFT_620509 [Mycena pura]|uniref:Uncharacterized protein n=1 Tax=Mycena pura TaxID=153505 RepID=A0AAD6UJC4_9AGAR|nr:hypothetical protein GGX14DRAFT_620509 [Mycena pura]
MPTPECPPNLHISGRKLKELKLVQEALRFEPRIIAMKPAPTPLRRKAAAAWARRGEAAGDRFLNCSGSRLTIFGVNFRSTRKPSCRFKVSLRHFSTMEGSEILRCQLGLLRIAHESPYMRSSASCRHFSQIEGGNRMCDNHGTRSDYPVDSGQGAWLVADTTHRQIQEEMAANFKLRRITASPSVDRALDKVIGSQIKPVKHRLKRYTLMKDRTGTWILKLMEVRSNLNVTKEHNDAASDSVDHLTRRGLGLTDTTATTSWQASNCITHGPAVPLRNMDCTDIQVASYVLCYRHLPSPIGSNTIQTFRTAWVSRNETNKVDGTGGGLAGAIGTDVSFQIQVGPFKLSVISLSRHFQPRHFEPMERDARERGVEAQQSGRPAFVAVTGQGGPVSSVKGASEASDAPTQYIQTGHIRVSPDRECADGHAVDSLADPCTPVNKSTQGIRDFSNPTILFVAYKFHYLS